MRFRFGPFAADRTTYRVTRGDAVVDLTPKLLDLLFHLLQHPAELVTKEALLDAVWPGANVTDNALAQAISDLRDALDDSAVAPLYIRTVARRGYRFVAPVEELGDALPRVGESAPRTERAAASPAGPTLIVLDFANVTGDAEVAWLGAGIAETVTSDLTALDHFRVVDRWRAARAARQWGDSIQDVAAAVGANLVVTGSFQRSGASLRITARILDASTGQTRADAKVDGRLQDVFALQDAIVSAFAREIGVARPARAGVQGAHETANLDAYRAYIEGWLKIESLDTTIIGDAIRDFQRAIALDPQYAIAYTGLANAEFVAFEMTRATASPDAAALASGTEHARHAVHLDDSLAEAHATLSFLLTSAGVFDEARRAAERAVLLEPDSWRHQYRLGHASWGDVRLRAFDRALALYPQFAYAQFERAMVFVARGDFQAAIDGARRGATAGDRPGRTGERFPGIGLHWLIGALQFVRADVAGAMAEFERELAQLDRRRLYGHEYAAISLVGRGHAELAREAPARAMASFTAALAEMPDYPRALLGLARAHEIAGSAAEAAAALAAARRAIGIYAEHRRDVEAEYLSACEAAVLGHREQAVATLERLLETTPASFIGWTIPLEPLFRPLHGQAGFARVLSRLRERAV